MADKAIEADDPYELIAHSAPLRDAADKDEMMARCFIEEYAMMGVPANRIMQLFRSQAFVGTNSILQERGEPFIAAIVDSVFGNAAVQAEPRTEADVSLAVPMVNQHQCNCGASGIIPAPSREEACHGHGL
ncbi:MAG: hypothetical protein KC482_03775 [Dehalococcoidia bacterium]|nr:hypothetical protein [Dehalococcoidia bacterium]MCA9825535.1 hypothetical protein [Dehalococcoidia bacterium]MCA9845806.1 hypothetical protein [Dehalococcoidia bacterium]MCA9852703.1 hypothetical protein [Dehalococcoidia bacterium]